MSLSKQLLILISLLFLMLFSINFALSVGNIKTYLEGESQSHAQDTATSLGLSLSPYIGNPHDPLIKAMVSAIFDMGYYSEIRLQDANANEIIKLRNEAKVEGVPDWFIDYLPMSPASASSEISSGWALGGVVTVTGNTAFAYAKLYQQAKISLYYALAVLALSIVSLGLVLRITLASLQRIEQLAQRISEGYFETLTDLPWTSEVKSLATSMNIMSGKIADTIGMLNRKLESMGDNLLRDDLSGFHKKTVFETDINHLLQEHSPAYLLVVKIDSLPELVKSHDRNTVDQLLTHISGKLRGIAQAYPDSNIRNYRFYGSEFAMLIHSGDAGQIATIANTLSLALTEIGEKFTRSDLGHIGIAAINPVGTLETILGTADEAYEQARLIGANAYFIRSCNDFSRDISAWKDLVYDTIDRQEYSLSYFGRITDFHAQQLLMEEAVAEVHDRSNQPVAIGPFVSVAEKFAKIDDFDKGVIEQALQYIQNKQIRHCVAVNLSVSTIKNSEFCYWLEKRFKDNSAAVRHLVFTLSAYAVAKDVAACLEFIDRLHQWGGKVMIKRFETQSISPELIKKLKPDYLRLARDMGDGISTSPKKYEFVQAMQQIGALLNIDILAENVYNDNDYQALKTLGIRGASR